MSSLLPQNVTSRKGFSLIEVVLAIGVFLITVLALVGLLGPTLQSVDEVEKTDEVSSIVNTVNAFLQSSPLIAVDGKPKFEAVYQAVASNNYATLFVFRSYLDGTSNQIVLKVGFDSAEVEGESPVLAESAVLAEADFSDAAGPIYRVVLTPSSVMPVAYRSVARSASTNTYSLDADYTDYMEGSLALELRIFPEDPGPSFVYQRDLNGLKDVEPIFTYNTAIVR
jgi:Tfp pilus assembly protein PilV